MTGVQGAEEFSHHKPVDRRSSQRPGQRRADTHPQGRHRTQAAMLPAADCPTHDGNDNYAVNSNHEQRVAQEGANDHALLYRRQRLIKLPQPGL